MKGLVDEVQVLLRENPGLDVNSREPHEHWSALHFAAFYNRPEVVKLLLAHPAIDVNALSKYESTPFCFGPGEKPSVCRSGVA